MSRAYFFSLSTGVIRQVCFQLDLFQGRTLGFEVHTNSAVTTVAVAALSDRSRDQGCGLGSGTESLEGRSHGGKSCRVSVSTFPVLRACVSLSLSVLHSPLYLSLTLSISDSLSLYLSPSLCLSLPLSVSESLSPSLCLSACLSLFLSPSLCLSVCLSVSLPQ